MESRRQFGEKLPGAVVGFGLGEALYRRDLFADVARLEHRLSAAPAAADG